MALVEEGQISPIAEQVAERAQVGLRSVFRHFNDMESLFAEMAVRLTRHYQGALVPFASGDWKGQLFEAMDRRIDIYEKLLPYKRAADAHRHSSPALQANHSETSRLLRARLRNMLPPALDDDAVAIETLDFLLSFDSWQRLRVEQNLSPEVARAVIEGQVKAFVAA
ncbi:TetR/AcrR family transcriptional regulator [Polymorphobacter fuscus]|nr:TetR/AcrR family transcriptional regulator [Polymorphobacter fuscus]NJC10119.1 AcrR family transcriptional regulator [Polymorphobacter fuscus]